MSFKNIANKYLLEIGFDKNKAKSFIKNYAWFSKDKKEFLKQADSAGDKSFEFELYPILSEKHATSGMLSGAYFHQDLLVAQKIFQANPSQHLDIGSSVYGFVSHVASFRHIEIADIRDNTSEIENIKFIKLDVMSDNLNLGKVYDSISSLHVLEHFGLGRYNDKIDYYGYEKGIKNIAGLLKPGGIFYMSVPIGKQKVYFNAHRVFDHGFILNVCKKYFTLIEFHYVNDRGSLFKNIDPDLFDSSSMVFGCGIFILQNKVLA